MSFVVKPTSLSYRLLAKFNSDYRAHKVWFSLPVEERRAKQADDWYRYREPRIATDFCSYWRSVFFILSVGLVGFLIFALGVNFWFHLDVLTRKTVDVVGFWDNVIGFVVAIGFVINVLVAACGAVLTLIWAIPRVVILYGRYIDYKHRDLPRDEDGDIIYPSKTERKHSFRGVCHKMYRAYKLKYCPIIEYKGFSDDSSAESE